MSSLTDIRKAAEQGDAEAQFNLGCMYDDGEDVPEDDTEAVKWYRKAAEQGHAGAQNNLGYMYEKGEGVSQEYTEAVKWYRKAAEQGDAEAQCNLGEMYKDGKGVQQDYAEAVKWYRKAAEQGKANAQGAGQDESQEEADKEVELSKDDSTDYTTTYGTARIICQFVSFVGWVVVIIGVLILIWSIGQIKNNGFALMGLFPAFACIMSGLASVMIGQLTRAMVDTADNTGQLLAVMKTRKWK